MTPHAAWPSGMDAVESADVHSLLKWNRFLPSPTTEAHIDMLNRIVVRLAEEREKAPGAYVQASKSIGW